MRSPQESLLDEPDAADVEAPEAQRQYIAELAALAKKHPGTFARHMHELLQSAEDDQRRARESQRVA